MFESKKIHNPTPVKKYLENFPLFSTLENLVILSRV